MLFSFDALAIGLILLAILAEAVRIAMWVGQDARPAPQAATQGAEEPAEA